MAIRTVTTLYKLIRLGLDASGMRALPESPLAGVTELLDQWSSGDNRGDGRDARARGQGREAFKVRRDHHDEFDEK